MPNNGHSHWATLEASFLNFVGCPVHVSKSLLVAPSAQFLWARLLINSLTSFVQSGSYNPVEEPSWMQSESFDLNVHANGPAGTTPECRDSGSSYLCETSNYDLRPAGLSVQLGEMSDPGSPKFVDSPHMNLTNSGADEAELKAYVQKKVQHSSLPFLSSHRGMILGRGLMASSH